MPFRTVSGQAFGIGRRNERTCPGSSLKWRWRMSRKTRPWRPTRDPIYSSAAESSWKRGRITWPTGAHRQDGFVDEIQRWLEASLAADPSEAARESWFDGLPKAPVALSFWLQVAIRMSETEPWWYDTLVEFARRSRQPTERDELPELPGNFANWCIGVAANDITRPRRRGRPANHMRDRLICTAVEAYLDRARDGEPVSHSEACGLVADAVGLDESVVAKIWRRSRQGQ